MTRAGRIFLWISTLIVPVCGLPSVPGTDAGERSLKLTPELIEMDAFYSGARVQVEGAAEAGARVVVVVRGENKEETFNKKVRAGPIWINSGKVHISGTPSVFLSFSEKPVDEFLDRAVIEEHQLDRAAIKNQMQIDAGGDQVDENAMRDNYLSLKTGEGIYQVVNGGITLGTPQDSLVPYSVEFDWPKTAPPAAYEVKAYECRDGRVVLQTSAPLNVVKVGFPAEISKLAMEKASQYGVIAVIIAVMAGFGIDFLAARLFGKKRKAKH
jgi:uncharacterized protein (TIGR02186 family)